MTSIVREHWGVMPDGRSAERFTMTNLSGMRVSVGDYGATILSIEAPDRNGALANVVLSYATLEDYIARRQYLGALVGRFANRIAFGRFALDGTEYKLSVNKPPHHLHGGIQGFGQRLWRADIIEGALKLLYKSSSGEEGYPGNLTASVTYILTNENELVVDCRAETDDATPVALTSHAYFNLAGSGDILDHHLVIAASQYVPVGSDLIPTGELATVADTPFDFRTTMPIGSRINDDHEQIHAGGGYDHNYVLDKCIVAARAADPVSGRTLSLTTNAPGLQFYSGNMLADGHERRSGFCLETQNFPDSPNHPHFSPSILRPGEVYQNRTVFRFGIIP